MDNLEGFPQFFRYVCEKHRYCHDYVPCTKCDQEILISLQNSQKRQREEEEAYPETIGALADLLKRRKDKKDKLDMDEMRKVIIKTILDASGTTNSVQLDPKLAPELIKELEKHFTVVKDTLGIFVHLE